MTGFVSFADNGGSAALNPFDLSQVPSNNVFEGQDPLQTSEAIVQGINRLTDNAAASADPSRPTRFSGDVTAAPPSPIISAQEANEKYAAPGLKFNNPLPDAVASSMYDAKLDENMRADVAARSASPIARDVVGFAAGMLDPVNIAASFLPVIGEGNVARMLGTAGAESFGAKLATRAVTGAATGAVTQAPLAALQYGLASQSQQDYTAADALKSVLMGAVFGGIAHPVVGGVLDAFGANDPLAGAFQNSPLAGQVGADPVLRQQAASAAIAATLEDRPVDVAPLIELGARQREQALALHSMQYDSAAPTAARLNALEDDLTRPGVPDALADNLTAQHEALTDISASESDIAGVRDQLADPVTQARIDAIDEELTKPGPLSSVRQQQLMQERGMLTEGAVPATPDEIALNSARAEAQRQGNQIAIDRNNQRIAALQDQIRQSATVREALGEPAPEAEQSSRAAAQTEKQFKDTTDTDLPDDLDHYEAVVQGMRDRGDLSPETEAALAAHEEAPENNGEAMAKAHESFANCMAGL
jgi:hypothetical protein